ncbi:uncharacterized protein LOC143022944 [Oratosquilla oratoria]|uniref:uncharacterized protein LOC143022944 n=1 Tax=Oratosquilla oratoria TaxID=337810 RepID=UPI003F773B3E
MCANVKIPLTPLLTTASGGGGQNPRISYTAIDKKKLELHQLLQNAVDDNKYSLCEDLLKKGAPVNAPDTFEDRPDRHPVIIAAKQGFLDILQLLLNNGGDTEVSDKNGQTALHHAALNDKAACCQELLGKGALVAATNNDGDTPLHVAVKHDSIEVCQKLLESNNIVDKINKKGYTPLHIAIKECNKIILSLLLDHNANRVIPDKRGYLPFHYAAKEGCLDCCRKLISHEDTVQRQINSMTKDGLTPLMLAAEGGFHHCCDLILRANIIHTDNNGNTTLQYKDKRGETALHHVMAGTFNETVSFLLDKGACPNTVNNNGDTPLLKAVGKATTICTELCVRNNGNLRIKNNGGQSVLHLAAQKNSLKNLEYLLPLDGIKEMIDDQDIKGFTAFHYTLKKKSIKCSLILFNNGASVNISTYSLMSPLHMLANTGFAELCELVLVQKDVQVNVKNKHKQTPLHLAAAQGSLECCSQLLLKGAKTSVKDSEGCTPCHSAASNNHIKCLELLARKGYDIIFAKDNGGYTALHYAAKFGSLSCCTYLVKRAKFLIWDETNKGDLPIELAFKNKKYEVLAFLIQNQYKKSGQSNFKIHVHKYMHSALQDMDHPKTRMVAIKAIIESVWWKSAFESHFETKQNSTDEYIFKVSKNFTYLIEHHPDLAMMVMDKCYNYNEKTWDFTIVENHFYIPGKVHESPFEKTGKLKNDATTSYENEHKWLEQNALTKMQLHKREELLVHRFTKAWLLHRWTSCAKNLFFIHLALEILFTILLFILLCMTRSWAHQTLKRDIMCNLPRCFVVSDSNCSKNINESLLMNCHNDLQQYVTSANESDMSPDMMKNSSLDVKPIILTLCSSVVPHISTANVALTIALASLSSLLFVIEVYALIKVSADNEYVYVYCT